MIAGVLPLPLIVDIFHWCTVQVRKLFIDCHKYCAPHSHATYFCSQGCVEQLIINSKAYLSLGDFLVSVVSTLILLSEEGGCRDGGGAELRSKKTPKLYKSRSPDQAEPPKITG
jgi:hypothetical protein